jgi:rhodanese-related sulfurtransferase
MVDSNHQLGLIVFFLLVAGISTLSCDDDADLAPGPCVHKYLDAVVHLASVRDHATQAPLDTVCMSAATVDGHVYSLTVLTLEEQADGITLVGDSVECIPPCSFGVKQGHWAVTLSARGFSRQAVEFDAAYAVGHGGCPSWSDGGTVVNLELRE